MIGGFSEGGWWCRARESNPHEENPHGILSPKIASLKARNLLYSRIKCASPLLRFIPAYSNLSTIEYKRGPCGQAGGRAETS